MSDDNRKEEEMQALDELEKRLNKARELAYIGTEVTGHRPTVGECKYRAILMAAHFNDELLADVVRGIINFEHHASEDVDEVIAAAEFLEAADYGARQIGLGNIKGGTELIGYGLKELDGRTIPARAGIIAKAMENYLGRQAKRFSEQFEE